MTEKIYVFESNLAGRHKKGEALVAFRNHGAIYGQGYGLQGSSFAIPTYDEELNPLSLNKIEKYVENFIKFAKLNPDKVFAVTRIGCLEHEDSEIAPLFADAPDNCQLPVGWRAYSQHSRR